MLCLIDIDQSSHVLQLQQADWQGGHYPVDLAVGLLSCQANGISDGISGLIDIDNLAVAHPLGRSGNRANNLQPLPAGVSHDNFDGGSPHV